jgi:hypothetical protein
MRNAKLKERQMTCGDAQCQREWHKKKCKEWYKDNVEYFRANYLQKKLDTASESAKAFKPTQAFMTPDQLGMIMESIGLKDVSYHLFMFGIMAVHVAPVLVDTAMAIADKGFRFLPALAAMAGALLLQISVNLANDYFDYTKGVDTSQQLRQVRVTQSGLIPPARVKTTIIVTLGLAATGAVEQIARRYRAEGQRGQGKGSFQKWGVSRKHEAEPVYVVNSEHIQPLRPRQFCFRLQLRYIYRDQ